MMLKEKLNYFRFLYASLAFVLLWLAMPLDAHAANVAVVMDAKLPVYRRVMTGFSVELRSSVREYSLDGKRDRGGKIFRDIIQTRPSLVLAIGPMAANLGQEFLPKDIPLIFTMVPNLEQYKDLKGSNIAGVALEQSLRTQLSTLKTVAPHTQSVGVVYSPKHTSRKIAAAKRDARSLGLKLITAEARSASDVKRAVGTLAGRVDALWMVPDPTVLNLAAFDALLDFSVKRKIPLFAINYKFVERGALVSMGLDYARIGQQAGRLADRIISGRTRPSDIGVQDPEGLDIAINLSTARAIGVQCDLAIDIFTYAAEQKYAIRVYK